MSEEQKKVEVIEAPKDKELRKNELLIQMLMIACISAVVSIGLRMGEKLFFEKEIIAVDLKKIMTIELEKTAAQIMTPEQRNERAKEFNLALEQSLDDISNNGRKIILVSPAVINGVNDYTQNIIEAIPKIIEDKQKRREAIK